MIMIFWSFLGTVHCTFLELLRALPLDPNRVPTWTNWGRGASSTPRPPAAIGDDLHHDFFTSLNICVDPCIERGGQTNIIHCKGG